jgi:hypothetical protein
VSVEINRAFAHWSANPLRAGVTLRSLPTGAHPAGRTALEIVNHTPFQVRVWIGEPACRTVTVAAKATATVPVAPGRMHRLAGRVTNPPPGVPIIPAYGEQTYSAGQVHRMNLGAVQL